jgi:hypothetical protein
MDTQEFLETIRSRGGEFAVDGKKLTVVPRGVLLDIDREYIKEHLPLVLSALTGRPMDDFIEGESFEVTKPAKPRVTVETWIERVKTHLMGKGAYYEWPAACLDGRNDPCGKQSLLEFLEEQGNVTLNVAGMFAFSITGSRLAEDNETVLGDFTFERWAFDDIGVAQLRVKVLKQAKAISAA